MFVLPTSCRLSPVQIACPSNRGDHMPFDDGLKLLFVIGSETEPLVSISSDSMEPTREGTNTYCEFPMMDIPLSREVLELFTTFTLVIVSAGTYHQPLWSSEPISFSDQSLRVFRDHFLKPVPQKLATATASFRLDLLPSGSIVPLLVDSREKSCPYCLPRKPRRKACAACSREGRLVCTGCRGQAKLKCADCLGLGYCTLSVAAVTCFASAVPVLSRQQCRACSGKSVVMCPICDGLGEVRCDGCGGAGDTRCPCSVSKLEEDQFI